MGVDETEPQLERERTDTSLRTERKSSDQVLADRLADTADEADEVLGRARADADAVVHVARERADRQQDVEDSRPTPISRDDLARERALEDDVVRTERAVADEALEREREEQHRVLLALLPFERDKTDRHLLTERKLSDDALANRDDFLGMVSHDLRNLLSGIVLSAERVADLGAGDDAAARTAAGLQRIQRYAARMNRLIGDLLDVASIDAGRLAVRAEDGDIVVLLAEAIEAFAPAAEAAGVTLRAETDAPTLPFAFDRARLFQVLANLITNALKFTSRGGTITVRGERLHGKLRLAVRDDGSGIPASQLEAVFERFWQVGKNDRRGLGLGLHISRSIVVAHGGRIWAENNDGPGTTFHVLIPPAPPA